MISTKFFAKSFTKHFSDEPISSSPHLRLSFFREFLEAL
jgi:hypothetical protein